MLALTMCLIHFATDQAHSSVERAGLLGAVRIRAVKSDGDFSLRGDALQAAIDKDRADGLIPFYVS